MKKKHKDDECDCDVCTTNLNGREVEINLECNLQQIFMMLVAFALTLKIPNVSGNNREALILVGSIFWKALKDQDVRIPGDMEVDFERLFGDSGGELVDVKAAAWN